MYVIYGYVELFLPYSSNLKAKRKVLQSILARVKNRCSISVTEVGFHDLWQRSILGFSAVVSNPSDLDLIKEIVFSTIDYFDSEVQITDHLIDSFPLSTDH